MASKFHSTRSSTSHEVYGQHIKKLSDEQLPKKIEILCHFLYRRDREFDQSYMRKDKLIKAFKPSTKVKIIKEITTEISEIWSLASIPTKSTRAIEISVESLIELCVILLRS